jgi:nucleoid-associated protein YgaU
MEGVALMGLEKASINGIPVLFNPTEYSLEKSNQFQDTSLPGLPSPITQFVSGGAQTLSMELFFDTYTDENGKDVRTYTDPITDLTKIDRSLHAPPICLFQWGKVQFQAVLERVSRRFTMFLADGTPVRAVLNVTFKEYVTLEEQVKGACLESSDRTKRRVIIRGDSLWLIASQEYGDPGEWRSIARANGIDNPRNLEAGKEIIIPPLR